VNLLAGAIRLDPGTTKNDDGREVMMTKQVRVLLEQCVLGKSPDEYVFTREENTPVRDFRSHLGQRVLRGRAGGNGLPAVRANGYQQASVQRVFTKVETQPV